MISEGHAAIADPLALHKLPAIGAEQICCDELMQLCASQQYNAEDTMKTAVTVKLVRNVSMSILIPLLAVLYFRGTGTTSRAGRRSTSTSSS